MECYSGPMKWENEARRIVRSELVRRGLTYKLLADHLRMIGLEETERSIANKMSRGTFSFVFFLQCMNSMGVTSVAFDLTIETPRVKRAVKRAPSP